MIRTTGNNYWTLGGSTRNIGPQDSVIMGNFQGASCILGPWEIDMEGGSLWGRFLKVSIREGVKTDILRSQADHKG